MIKFKVSSLKKLFNKNDVDGSRFKLNLDGPTPSISATRQQFVYLLRRALEIQLISYHETTLSSDDEMNRTIIGMAYKYLIEDLYYKEDNTEVKVPFKLKELERS